MGTCFTVDAWKPRIEPPHKGYFVGRDEGDPTSLIAPRTVSHGSNHLSKIAQYMLGTESLRNNELGMVAKSLSINQVDTVCMDNIESVPNCELDNTRRISCFQCVQGDNSNTIAQCTGVRIHEFDSVNSVQHLKVNTHSKVNTELNLDTDSIRQRLLVKGVDQVISPTQQDYERVQVNERKVNELFQSINLLYELKGTYEHRAMEIITEAYKVTDSIFGVQDAINWGKGFKWPDNVFTRDALRAAQSEFNLSSMTMKHQASMAHDRLSLDRISRWISPDDPAYNLLIDLVMGMKLFIDDNFVPNNAPPPKRKLYLEVCQAVNKGFLESWEDDLVFIFPKNIMTQFGDIHYSPVHWTTKVGKECGRTLFDSSDDKYGSSLNSDQARELIRNYYGEITHPTIEDIVNMVLDFIRENQCSIKDIVLYKADLSKAFTLLSFDSKSVHLLACELTDDLVMVYHSGLFGWTGTPFCFHVVTGALERAINLRVKGRTKMYVDDIVGVTLLKNLMHDQSKCYEVCEGLLGSKAVAKHKWESGRRLDVIGYTIDLDIMRVTISRRNFLKTLYGFFSVKETNQVTIKELERLASWSSRYQLVLRHTRSLTTLLYAQICGITNRNISKFISPEGQQAIRLWRMLLVLSNLDETQFTRSLHSFRDLTPTVCIEYDASLTGIGIYLSVMDKGISVTDIGYGSFKFPFDLHQDPSNQNVCEFIAVVVALVILIQRGYTNTTISLRGDSKTSLKWGRTERFKGVRGLSASVVYLLLGSHYDLWVSDAHHLPKEFNTLCDSLSRGKSVVDLGIDEKFDLRLGHNPIVDEVARLCNPTTNMLTPHSIEKLWTCVTKIISRLPRL